MIGPVRWLLRRLLGGWGRRLFFLLLVLEHANVYYRYGVGPETPMLLGLAWLETLIMAGASLYLYLWYKEDPWSPLARLYWLPLAYGILANIARLVY